jgi:hypothetical protein
VTGTGLAATRSEPCAQESMGDETQTGRTHQRWVAVASWSRTSYCGDQVTTDLPQCCRTADRRTAETFAQEEQAEAWSDVI